MTFKAVIVAAIKVMLSLFELIVVFALTDCYRNPPIVVKSLYSVNHNIHLDSLLIVSR